jgi:hypothetical protein
MNAEVWGWALWQSTMPSAGRAVVGALGLLFGLLSAYHEYVWRRRLRTWRKTTGRVVGYARDESASYPEIEYESNGVPRRFVSRYAFSKQPSVRSTVGVIYEPLSGTAEVLSAANRWAFTVAPALAALVLMGIALFVKVEG